MFTSKKFEKTFTCKEHVLYDNYLKINAELFCGYRWNWIMTFTFSFVINFNIDQSIYLFTIQKYSIEKIVISLLYVYIFYFQIFYLKPSKIFLRNMKSAKFVYIYTRSVRKLHKHASKSPSNWNDSKYISILLRRQIRIYAI